jgi:hypothetical protein
MNHEIDEMRLMIDFETVFACLEDLDKILLE